MMKKIPTYLQNRVKNYQEEDFATMTICAADQSDLLEVWYYGDFFLVESEGRDYIVATDDAPALVVAKHPNTGEEILVFDGAQHGYDNMFCDIYEAEVLANRTLQRLDIPASKIIVELGYSIDYESEKEEYDFDDEGKVMLIDGRRMAWEDVIVNGFDYIAISYVDEQGEKIQFLDAELA